MNKKLVALLTALVLTVSLFAGFAMAESDESYEFIFVCPIVGLEYWNLCADGIAAADAEFGTSTQIVGPTDASNFVTEVVTYMESAIATQPDGIFCYAGLESMPRLLEEAAAAGIPVVTIDSDCSDTTNRIAYAGTDPYNAGYASGEAMIEATGGEGTVAILTSSLGAEKEQEELAAFMDAIEDTNLEVVVTEETNADLATGVTKMEAIVQTYPDLTAVLGTSAYDVQAAARVKYEYGLDDLKLVGYDDQEETLRYIREGVIDAIIVQDPYTMGYLGVKNLYDYLTTGAVENEHVDTGTITVTIENVDSYR